MLAAVAAAGTTVAVTVATVAVAVRGLWRQFRSSVLDDMASFAVGIVIAVVAAPTVAVAIVAAAVVAVGFLTAVPAKALAPKHFKKFCTCSKLSVSSLCRLCRCLSSFSSSAS